MNNLSLSVDLNITEHPAPVPPVGERRTVIVGDEELLEYHYQSRTSPENMGWLYPCTPSVFRLFKEPIEKQGDFRVDITPMRPALLALNGGDEKKLEYLFNPGTALFNSTGYPRQMYATMSGNTVKVIGRFGEWCKIETLRPTDNVSHMTYETHPHFVHKFDLVCWRATEKRTFHRENTPRGIIRYFLVTNEGYAWILSRYIKEA